MNNNTQTTATSKPNISKPNVSKPNLRNILLRNRLNISKNSWNQFDDKWLDEIYINKTNKTNDPFKYCRKYPVRICEIDVNKFDVPTNLPTITQLENEITDLRFKVEILSIINIGLIAFHLFMN